MASSAWKGAVEFGGFPIHVRFYNRKKSRSSDSFKTIAPDGAPVRSVYLDSSGKQVDAADCSKGVKTGKDTFTVLSEEAVEQIKSVGRSEVLSPEQFPPVASIPFELALGAWAVIPDKDVAGAEKSATTLWNGLRASGLAYATDIVMSSGSRDSILVLYADDDGLWAVTLPYVAELQDVPSFAWEKDEAQAEFVAKAIETVHDEDTEPFDHPRYASEYAERRKDAIDAAIAGKPIKPAAKSADTPEVPDLMAALKASVDKAKPKAAKKASARKKVTA